MKRFGARMVVIAVVGLCVISEAFADTARPGMASGRADLTLSRSPLHFEPNLGQADARVRFLARGQGYGIYVTPTETVLALATSGSGAADILRMRLLGSNPQPVIEGQIPLRGRSNYFIGSDPAKWQRGVPHYGSLLVQEVYPGIDLAYHGNPRQLEYDFLVAPGADPGRIRLRFDGFTSRRLDRDGNLVLSTKSGTLVQKRPFAYQDIAGVRKAIASRYELGARNEVRIVVGGYDRQRRLVIDPVLVYSTYLGGSAIDEPRAVAVDGEAAVYLTGYTRFPTAAPFPTTPGAIQTTYGGGNTDVFVSKLDPAGQGAADLVYSTYLGGPNDDIGWGLAVDGLGAAHVVGETSSAGSGFPTTHGAFQTSSIDGWDAFVVKLDPLGGLAYSSYLGGGDIDEAKGVTLDPSGIVYVAGMTRSPAAPGAFPTTAGAYQTVNAGDYDGFVVKLNPQGSGTADLLYSTLFGGAALDAPQSVKLHGSTIYIAGYSYGSGMLPTTPRAFQALNAGEHDAFLAVFNPAGAGQADLVYATYLGGNKLDVCFGLAVDASGVAYVGGYTEGGPNSFPTTAGAYQTSFGGILDVVLAKINPAGAGSSDLVYSTFVGGPYVDYALGLAIDGAGTVYLTGAAGPDYPTTLGAYREVNIGQFDAILTRLNPAGGGTADLLYSTYLGGTDHDHGYAIAIGADGIPNIAGSTGGVIPTTSGAFQTTNAGEYDVFLAKLAASPPIPSQVLFLHGHGTVENSPILFLDEMPPTATTPRYRDSGALKVAGGNPWKAVGTWSADPAATTGTLVLDRMQAWFGLKKSSDESTRFDLRAELMKNGAAFVSDERYCIQGIVDDPDGAKRVAFSFDPATPMSFNGTTDELSLKLWARIGTDGAGQSCGGNSSAAGLRVYFDATSRPAAVSGTEP